MIQLIRYFVYMMFVCCLLSGGKMTAANKTNPDNTKKFNEFFEKGVVLNREGKYDSARMVFNEALAIKGGKEYTGGRILVNLANSFFYQENYIEALKYYLEALRYAKLEKNESSRATFEARAMGNISECYYVIGNQSQALYYANQSLSVLLKVKDPWVYLKAQPLYIVGAICLDNKEYEKAEENMQKTIRLSDTVSVREKARGAKPSMLWYKAYGQEGMSRIWLARNDSQKAADYARQSIQTAEEYGDPAVTAKCWLALSNVYLHQKQYEECLNAALKATELSSEAIRVNPELAYNIAITSMYLGEETKAEDYLRIYSGQMKKNTDRNFRETIASMDVLYETEKKQMRILSLEKERLLYVCLIALSCVSMLSLILFWRQRTKRHQQEKALVEMKATAKGIMEGETKERERLAVELHDGVQGLLTAVKLSLNDYEKAQMLVDKAIEEVRNISRNLMSNTLKQFGLRAAIEDYCLAFPHVEFRFFGSDCRIVEHIESLLYRCAQELVTNSIKYSESKEINVQLVQESAHVTLTVFDDGKGFDIATTGKGIGISGIRHRIDAVNGYIDIISSPENGTETTIEIRI
ncbi:MAG: sensor histidine kinase [Tannerella sp.]|jgi:signal transduction histidine kinase|nr:sensor histidine kinase [Tannerella sp.]